MNLEKELNELDYLNYEDGKYPEPEDRCIASDFPKPEELYTYGVDFPMPESFDDLRGHYNERDEAPLVLEDLRGYKVPPLGLHTIGVNGNGFQPKRDERGGGFIYGPDTFRKDLFGINKALGPRHEDMVAVREENRKNAVIDALASLFESEGYTQIDVLKEKDPQVMAAGISWVFKMINASKNEREALNFLKFIWEKTEYKEDVLARLKERSLAARLAGQSMELVDKLLDELDDERRRREAYESVDISVQDIDE
jgi:hypothetical protein